MKDVEGKIRDRNIQISLLPNGVLTIPKYLRERFHIEKGSEIEMKQVGDTIELSVYNDLSLCFFCHEAKEDMLDFNGKSICKDCIKELKKLKNNTNLKNNAD